MIKRKLKQHFFAAKALQSTIAILVIVALIGGILLQVVSKSLTDFLGLDASYLSLILVAGYVVIIVFCALIFSHRLIGPFKRLEYEMKWIADGELDRRLTVRTHDDLHVKSFVENVNALIGKFEEMSLEYNKLNSAISKCVEEVSEKLGSGMSSDEMKTDLEKLQDQIHKMRESW